MNVDNLRTQVLAGEQIQASLLGSLLGPNKEQRARNVTRDPYASAQFFHFLMKVTFESLFGVSSNSSTISVEPGVAGKVSAFFGTVESQGRGSLHLHLLVYLEGSPSPQRMQSLLEQSAFREKVARFMQLVIHAEIPGLSCKEDLQEIPNEVEIAWTRPPNPNLPNDSYKEQLRRFEIRVARAKQVHTCSLRRCLGVDKHG